MTLIFSCLTRDYVLQVSDRRLSSVKENPDKTYTFEPYDDDRNKAIVVDRTWIFAYTGWSKIDGDRTDDWFANIIKPFVDTDQLHQGMLEVARRATIFFAKQHNCPPELKHHTFIGVGWKQRTRDGILIPSAIRISNTFDNQHQPLRQARPDFIYSTTQLRRQSEVKLLANGLPIDEAEIISLQRQLRRSYYLSTPQNTARVLAKKLSNIADKWPKGTVGKGVVITCIPKSTIFTWPNDVLGPPDGKRLSMFYIPPFGKGQEILRSPIVVLKGFPFIFSDAGITIDLADKEHDPYSTWR